MKQFITDDEVEKALNFLRDTAKDYAKWRSRAKYLEKHRKSVRGAEYLAVMEGTISEKTAKAETSAAYREVLKQWEEAEYEYTLLDARRNAAQTKIEAWRTIAASNRQGNI